MLRFSLKDVLRGITLASIGFGMLAAASHQWVAQLSKELTIGHAFLVAFGGMFVGYGLAFSMKYPPHQMIFAMIGMFAAQSWDSGTNLGLMVYVSLILLFTAVGGFRNHQAKRDGSEKDSAAKS